MTVSLHTHGLTVDSSIICCHFFKYLATVSVALITGVKSGLCSSSIGVGTQMSIYLDSSKHSGVITHFISISNISFSASSSSTGEILLFILLIFSSFVSYQ
jgi:hypothetical protein